MAIVTTNYASTATLTITLASLASNANLIGGQESNEVDNTSNKYTDVMIQGKITVGSTVTTSTQIQLYVWGSDTSAATKNLDVIDGVDSAESFATVGVRDSVVKLGKVISVDSTTANRTYYISSFSISELFGGNMPEYWGIWVTHNTGSNLNSTSSNHEITYTGIKYDIT